jgi:hypothetical protein
MQINLTGVDAEAFSKALLEATFSERQSEQLPADT